MFASFLPRNMGLVPMCTGVSYHRTLISLCSRKIPRCHHSVLQNQIKNDCTQFLLCAPALRHNVRHKSGTDLLKAHLRGAQKKKVPKELEELPELKEDDLEEDNVLGSGPGGQAVNKSANACFLRHKPTGIVVKSHKTRSYELNRQYARFELRHKLDAHYNRENSVRARALREAVHRKSDKKRKSNERLEKLRAFKEREGLT